MTYDKLTIAASKVVLNRFLPGDLINAAVDALSSGLDSRSLRILAGLTLSESNEELSMFKQALKELDMPLPDQHEAAMFLARDYAKQILEGDISALEGARRIWDVSIIPHEHVAELDTFVYGASEWEDRPEDRELFEKGIIAAAKGLVNCQDDSKH